jgi:hypothetical protein
MAAEPALLVAEPAETVCARLPAALAPRVHRRA